MGRGGLGPGSQPGLTVTEMINAAGTGVLRAIFILGENPVLTDPDSSHVRRSLSAAEFIVLQEIFPSETSAYADVLLPGASFAERGGTFTNTERRVQLFRPAITPRGECRPDWLILCELALAASELAHVQNRRAGVVWARDRPLQPLATLQPFVRDADLRRRLARTAGAWRAVAVAGRGPRPRRHADSARGPVHSRQGPVPRGRSFTGRRTTRRRISATADHRSRALSLARW